MLDLLWYPSTNVSHHRALQRVLMRRTDTASKRTSRHSSRYAAGNDTSWRNLPSDHTERGKAISALGISIAIIARERHDDSR